MKEQLLHILDQSVCLTRKQMREYLSGAMLPEEAHAAELHLNSCPLCHLALEGFEEHSDEALEAIAALNSGFLKEHFDNISPQIHLNSMAPAAAMSAAHRGRTHHMPLLWRVGSIAAGVLLLFGLVWALERKHSSEPLPPPLTVSEPGIRSVQQAASSSPAGDALREAQTPAARHAKEPAYAARREAEKALTAPLGAESAAVAPAAGALSTMEDVQKIAMPNAVAKPSITPAETTGRHFYQEYDAANNGSETQVGNSVTEAKKTASAPNAEAERTKPAHARESYSEGSTEAALKANLQGMKSSDPVRRYQSMIMAAQCYDALGQRAKAEELLQKVIEEAPGHERRQARRILRKLK